MTEFLSQHYYLLASIFAVLLVVGITGLAAKKESLTWRFWCIIATALLSGLTAWVVPPRLGIDLAGGTSLLYELDLSKIPDNGHDSTTDLATRVIAILKNRVDPTGVKNMIWRVVGGKRIQIQMPQADAATKAARDERDAAEKELQATALKLPEIMSAINKPAGAEREAAIRKIPRLGEGEGVDAQAKLIEALAVANDALEAAKAQAAKFELGKVPQNIFDQKYQAQIAFDQAQKAVKESDVDFATLTKLMSSADNVKNVLAQTELAALPAQYPRQKTKIERLIAAHKNEMAISGGGVDDPAQLQRLLTAAGVLEFRIAFTPGEISNEDYLLAVQSLAQYGPDRQVTVLGTHAQWFEIDVNSKDNFSRAGYIISTWEKGGGGDYILCYDDTLHTLTHNDPPFKPWSVSAGEPTSDPMAGGALSLPFRLDPVGAKYMGDLTSYNKNHPMTILLDGKAITAPNIQTQITDSGQITFGTPSSTHPIEAIKKEALQLKQIMDAGSLPATLQSQPISILEITPDMGKENIERGTRSAIYAVLAVVIFMLVYYTITGLFANLALMLNLALVLAAMAFLHGTFTLPGIAGLVLTLGMAVDANVLINERIREELHKGASLWMAIKQGYDKVFWTIFDANLTCSLTSVVLIYVGSEEVKGFGVTLLIGLIIHMFTALFVTRTFMMAAVRWGILRAIDDHSVSEYLKEIFTFTWIRNGHWPFMRVITVTNIDWISKRYIFWGISAVITIAGLCAFVMRGEDKYDIEFRGGTQVTFSLKPDKAGNYMNDDQVRARVEEMATLPGLKDLRNARVYGTGKPEDHRFELETTINNPANDPKYVERTLLDPLANKFSDVLNITPVVNFSHENSDEKAVAQLQDEGVIRPITPDAGTLDQVFAKTDVKGIPNHDVSGSRGGVAILLDNMNPPQTVKSLTDRINTTRQSPDISADTPYREFTIVPVTAEAGDGKTEPATVDDKRPLTRAVMVVSVETPSQYDENAEQLWQIRVASKEWKVVRQSMTIVSRFQGVTTFDAVVAGEAKQQAVLAIVLSLILIVIYVWIRFGGIWYGVGAIISLAHDAIVALAATVLSGVIYISVFGGHPNWLLLADFKINLTMIAAYLTIIGYSVNDTIVIFDRVRELRGRSTAPLTAKLINDAINQCFGRTIWTTFTVFIVVLIMYIWGGEGVRGFSFAMLVGVITGAYSTLAIASPMLLTTSRMEKGGGPKGPNPFLKRVEGDVVEGSELVRTVTPTPNPGNA